MILNIPKDIKFSNYNKKLNSLSISLIILSILVLLLKGLNLGIDFKGGTLIEIRTENSNVNISEIRQSFIKMNLGDDTVKKFGKENDYFVKIEMIKSKNDDFIKSYNYSNLSNNLYKILNNIKNIVEVEYYKKVKIHKFFINRNSNTKKIIYNNNEEYIITCFIEYY